MVEIHEPVRLLFVVETTPATMLRVMDANPLVGRLIRNDWVHVALLDPRSNAMLLWRDGAFCPYRPESAHLPSARASVDWYRGWREHLEFAEIVDGSGDA
jgi:hypothetical protein